MDNKGIDVVVLDHTIPFNDTLLKLRYHSLVLILDGHMQIDCNGIKEQLEKGEAIMIKKNCSATFSVPASTRSKFRSIFLFFDESCLRYALMPFEIIKNTADIDYFKVPLNEKLNVFTQSLLSYSSEHNNDAEWSLLLKNKLKELIWIFFHSDIRDSARIFFHADLSKE